MRNIALVVLDSVRKDVFDECAPRLQAEADVRFEQCRAASSWSVPSHASMFTGTLPHEHGIHTYSRDFGDLARADTFLGELPEHRALGASANVYASEAFGFDALFDEFVSVSPDRRFPAGMDAAKFGHQCDRTGLGKYLAFVRAAARHDHPLRSLANGALVELDDAMERLPVPKPLDDGARSVGRAAERLVAEGGDDEEPFFLFANFMDAHGPLSPVAAFDGDVYDVPNGWVSADVEWGAAVAEGDRTAIERYESLYGAAIDYLDRRVLALVERLRERTERPTTVVVTSDHGDNLGGPADEHLWEHSDSSLTEGLLHVPALVVDPPEAFEPDDGYLSHLDLGDLLVALATGEALPEVTRDEVPAERAGNNRPDAGNDPMVRCVYRGDRKYCYDSDGGRTAYRLDPGRPSWQEPTDESVPVDDLEAAHFSVPIAEAHERASERARDVDVDEATADRLRDLGYV